MGRSLITKAMAKEGLAEDWQAKKTVTSVSEGSNGPFLKPRKLLEYCCQSKAEIHDSKKKAKLSNAV